MEPVIILNKISKWFPIAEENPVMAAVEKDHQMHTGEGELSSAELAGDTENNQIKGGFFHALKDISLSIPKSSCLVITGANGSGKTLLMNIIAGLEESSEGSVQRKEKVGLVFQDAESQILGETPREDIAVGLKAKRVPKKEIRQITEKVLSETGLLEKADFPARFLSGGEKRRLAVAAVLAINADIIIFDEPYTALDYQGVIEVNKQIRHLKESGKTVIIISHELEKCLAFADQFVVLQKGRLVFNGNPQDALACPENMAQWEIHYPYSSCSCFEELVWL